MGDLDPDSNFVDLALPQDLCKYFTVAEINNNDSLNSSQFSLINYNICSFNHNGALFESLLESVNLKFKCIIISETWNNDSNMEQCKLPNYKEYHTPRSGDDVLTKSGGISVFYSEEIIAKKMTTCQFVMLILKLVLFTLNI